MFNLLGDVIFVAVGFLGAFTLIKFKPAVAGLIQKNVSDTEDQIATAVTKK